MKIFFQFLFVLLLIFSSVFAQDRIRSSNLINKNKKDNILKALPFGEGWVGLNSFEKINEADGYVIDEEYYQQWNNNSSEWEQNYRYENTYNAAGKIILNEASNWNQSSWEAFYRAEYEYNDTLLATLKEYWDNGTELELTSKTEYEYNSNNLLADKTFYLWDGFAWIDDERWSYEYNSEGLVTDETHQVWSSGVWENESMIIYDYDANSNLILHLGKIWWLNTSWANDYRFIFSYDSNNLVDSIKYQDWNIIQFSWVDKTLSDYNYNANSHINDITTLEWDGSQWNNVQRILVTWNDDLEANHIIQNWNTQWVNYLQTIYTYDENDNKTNETVQEWAGSIWLNDYRRLYYYSLITDVEDETVTLSDYGLSQNYPNPFNPTTNFEFRISDLFL